MFYAMKLRLFLSVCYRTARFEEYLEVGKRDWQEDMDNCIMRRYKISNLYHI